jgi:uncharacterized protein (TIGR00297 family)
MRHTMSDAANVEPASIERAQKRRTSEAGEVLSIFLSATLIAAFIGIHWNSELVKIRHVAPWAALAAAVFAQFGYIVRGVTGTGAVAGFAVAFVLWTVAGWGSLGVLLAVFALTWIATRFGRARKQQLGVAERRTGRTGLQVLANVGLAAVFCIFTPPFHPWWLCCMAVLAEAAADTVSSEIGQAIGGKPRLISNFRRVPVGSNGAVTLTGTVAGLVAALLVTGAAYFTDTVGLPLVPPMAAGAIGGMLFDSVLGATLEGKFLNNDAVNFFSTAFAAVTALAADRWLPLLY